MRMLIYAALLLFCTLYAFAKGGRPEKLGAAILFVGSILSMVVNSPIATRYGTIEIGILIVDAAVLVGFMLLALRTDRYWALWTTSFQLLGTLSHLARVMDSEMTRNGYGFILAAWGYLIALSIIAGTWAHQRSIKTEGLNSLSPYSGD